MKFDICIMNPPYGVRGKGKDILHFNFTEKCNQISNETLCIMPFNLVTSRYETYKTYKNSLGRNLINVEEVSNSIFDIKRDIQTTLGIYHFINDKRLAEKKNIHIKYLNGCEQDSYTLDGNTFTSYEENILSYLKPAIKKGEKIIWAGYTDKPEKNRERWCKKYSLNTNISHDELLYVIRSYQMTRLPDNKVYLTALCHGTKEKSSFIPQNIECIYTNKDDIIDMLTIKKSADGYNFLIFNTILEAEQCLIALQNSLLRFPLTHLITDRNMKIKDCYIYIPDIDWSDPRVITDEGLLEVCGCPKDKCKEYAEYCKNYMEEFDKKKHKKY